MRKWCSDVSSYIPMPYHKQTAQLSLSFVTYNHFTMSVNVILFSTHDSNFISKFDWLSSSCVTVSFYSTPLKKDRAHSGEVYGSLHGISRDRYCLFILVAIYSFLLGTIVLVPETSPFVRSQLSSIPIVTDRLNAVNFRRWNHRCLNMFILDPDEGTSRSAFVRASTLSQLSYTVIDDGSFPSCKACS